MLNNEPDASRWRAFQLFLADLEDEELPGVRLQLEREEMARRERDCNAFRLFFSSLTTQELETARHAIDFVCTPLEPTPKPVVRIRRSRKANANGPETGKLLTRANEKRPERRSGLHVVEEICDLFTWPTGTGAVRPVFASARSSRASVLDCSGNPAHCAPASRSPT